MFCRGLYSILIISDVLIWPELRDLYVLFLQPSLRIASVLVIVVGIVIFDQNFGETVYGLTVGVIIDENEINIHLMPIGTNSGQPTPLPDKQTKSILEKISDQSSTDLQDEILTGQITISYER